MVEREVKEEAEEEEEEDHIINVFELHNNTIELCLTLHNVLVYETFIVF